MGGGGHTRVREGLATIAVGLLTVAVCLGWLTWDPVFFWHDDYQIGGVPVNHDLHRALSAGEWPLLTPFSWVHPSFAAEYVGGVFSPVVLAGAWLAASLGRDMAQEGAVYGIYLLAITAMGAYRLGRVEGLAPPFATMVALVAALNGWSIAWGATNWICAAAGFAALTWAWWALARLARRGGGWPAMTVAAGAIALLLTSGWPHTAFMALLVSAWVLARGGASTRLLTWLGLAWLAGAGLSAPAWLCFLENLPHTYRSTVSGGWQLSWLVPLSSLPGLLLPTVTVPWDAFGKPKLHVAIELANGLVPAVAALTLASRAGGWRHARWELGLTLTVLALCCLPSLGMFRWSFRWLPLFHTALALLAARLLQRHLEAVAGRAFRWPENLGIVAALWVLAGHAAASLGPSVGPGLTLAYLAVAALWAGSEELHRRGVAGLRWAAPALTLLALSATYRLLPNGLAVPNWRLPEAVTRQAPLHPGVRYLVLASLKDYFPGGWAVGTFGPHLRPGMTQLLAGVEFINGYTALAPRGSASTLLSGVHGYLDEHTIDRVLRFDVRPGGLLERLGVGGLILGDRERARATELEARGWVRVSEGPDGVVLHRPAPQAPWLHGLPGVRFAQPQLGGTWWRALTQPDGLPAAFANAPEAPGAVVRFGARALQPAHHGRNALAFDVGPGSTPALVGVRRAWTPGWRAELGGQPLRLLALDGLAVGVWIPAGVSGRVTLVYWPEGLRVGAPLAGLTALLLLGGLLLRRRRPEGAVGVSG